MNTYSRLKAKKKIKPSYKKLARNNGNMKWMFIDAHIKLLLVRAM